MEAGVGGRGMKTGDKKAEPFLLLAAALDSQRTGCFPGLAELLGALKGMLGPGKASVMGSGSQWRSRELVGKEEGDLASGLSCACL